jgi:AAA15 family ATPase/GTPase
MSRLIVRNIGPIHSVDIDLKKVNVFIGPQSSGKSTLAKIISFCSWMEKCNENFESAQLRGVYNLLQSYHRLKGYFSDDSVILYIGDNISYAFNWAKSEPLPINGALESNCVNEKEVFFFSKEKKINPKVIYIPSERNFVSAVPSLLNYAEDNDNLQDFVNTWYSVRRKYSKDSAVDILGLGVKYYHQENDYSDNIMLDNGKSIPLDAASSGLQSIVPLKVLVDWFSKGLYEEDKPFSPAEHDEVIKLINTFSSGNNDERTRKMAERLSGFIKGKIYTHTQFIIEEPEQNLFPKTQRNFLYYLLSSINHGKDHRLVLTTHSPYILYALNNCLMGSLIRDKMPDEEKNELTSFNSSAWIASENVNVWQIKDGELHSIKNDSGTIGKHYFNGIMNDVMDEYYQMLAYLE